MTKRVKKFELLLFTGVDDQQTKRLEAAAERGGYGAKGVFIKARLLRGYSSLMRQAKAIRGEGDDPLLAMERLGNALGPEAADNGLYRALVNLIYRDDAEGDLAPTRPPARSTAAPADPASLGAPPGLPATNPPPGTPPIGSGDAQEMEPPRAAPPAPNWGVFAGLGGGGKK